ncbi:histone-like nucleoid-structuring protein, MvaT/MvaU family, partial [Pseudomonas putida]|uniref:histone-like nucleoid-structuring protein, MvaT/MvaU family n=1 Tax=Pseudomonas putida TaxID=303 RepID=UPI00119827E4
MSKAAEYRALERQIAEQLQALEALKGSEALQQELEFEDKLRKLLGEYGMSLRNVIAILDPKAAAGAGAAISGKVDGRKGPRAPQCHQPKLQPCPRQAPRSSQPPWPSGDDQASAAQSGGLAGLAV